MDPDRLAEVTRNIAGLVMITCRIRSASEKVSKSFFAVQVITYVVNGFRSEMA